MPTDVEDGVKLAHAGHHLGQAVRVGPQRLLRLEEGGRDLVVLEHLDRARVDLGVAALGRGDDHLDLVLEHVVRVGKFRLFSSLDVYVSKYKSE